RAQGQGTADAAMVQNFLEFLRGFLSLSCFQISLTADIIRHHASGPAELVMRGCLEYVDGLGGVAAVDLNPAVDRRQPNPVDESVTRKTLAQFLGDCCSLTDVSTRGKGNTRERQCAPPSIQSQGRPRSFPGLSHVPRFRFDRRLA